MKPSEYVRKGWCQGASAKDADGIVCNPDSPLATQWCTLGAITAAYSDSVRTREIVATKVYKIIADGSIGYWNDDPSRTKQQVIQLLESIGE